jgi:hypothetical protein
MEPVIDHYLGLNMDFVALRLRRGQGGQPHGAGARDARRVPAPAAAAHDRRGRRRPVGLSLTVLAESRIEAMNFPNGEIRDEDFTYDWNAPPRTSGACFGDAFAARNRAAGDRLWLTESPMTVNRDDLANLARFLPRRTGFGPDAARMRRSARGPTP